ncbi:MAG: tetratricopeptide repeat protein, partial [Chrysiogenales bacterium]
MRITIAILFIIIIIVVFIVIKSTSFQARIQKAEEYLDSGSISKANEIVKKILDRKSDYPPARYLRALILMKQNQYVLAISEFNSVLALPNFNKYINEVDIHYHLARLYSETKNFPKEIDEYKAILIFNPDDLVANHRIGHALFKKNDFKKAREHLEKAISINPSLNDIYFPLGISSYNVSDYDRAEQCLLKTLALSGANPEAEFHLGMIYHIKRDYDNAIIMFQKAKNERKFFLKSLFKIGEINNALEDYDNAIEIMEQGLVNLKDKSEEAHEYRYLLADCYEQKNKIKEAFHHWSKIAEDNPGFKNTRMKLESYQEILGNVSMMTIFTSSLDSLQPLIVELISGLNYNIISKERTNPHLYQYKAYNIKRINDPP